MNFSGSVPVPKFRDNRRSKNNSAIFREKALFRDIPRFTRDSVIFRGKSGIPRYRGDRGKIPPLAGGGAIQQICIQFDYSRTHTHTNYNIYDKYLEYH